MHQMLFRPGGTHTVFRYLGDTRKVDLCTDLRSATDERHARYMTIPYDRAPEGRVLYATTMEMILGDDLGAGIGVVQLSLAEAKRLSTMMHLPLLVGMSAKCDLSTRSVVSEVFFFQPERLATVRFDRRRRRTPNV